MMYKKYYLNEMDSNSFNNTLVMDDSVNEELNYSNTNYKFDLYNNPEYITANIEAEQFENSNVANYYKDCFCLKECGDYKIRLDTLCRDFENIEPYIYNSFEDVKSHRKKQLCVLGKNHIGNCCDKPVLFKKNIISDKLVKSVDSCIYTSPGNDDYIYKNRASRLHPIHIPKSIERLIRNKNKKLKCAIPLCEYSSPFMLATAYIDWICYIVNIKDIGQLEFLDLEQNAKFISILREEHKTFLTNYFNQFNRKVFDENNYTICVIAKNTVLMKDVSDPERDNRIVIEPEDIQMGHIKSRNDEYFSVRGTNIVMMSRYGNRVIGEDSFIENIWIEKLKNIIKNY